MKKTTLETKVLSLIIMLTMLVGMVPLSGMISFAVDQSTEPFDISATATLGEDMTLTLPSQADGMIYVKFVPDTSDTYVIQAISAGSDPYLELYDSEGMQIASDDDSGGNLLFYLEADLEAGNAYYLGMYDLREKYDCTFVVKKFCEHIFVGEKTCGGTLCSLCLRYYGEVSESNHAGDIVANGFCDGCDAFMPTVSGSVSVGENTVTLPYSDDGVKFFTFVPSEDGEYVIMSESDTDPCLKMYSEGGSCLGTSDDENGYNFKLSIKLIADETYYLGMYDCDGEYSCKVIMKKLCDEHTPTGDATCKGTLCSVCYEYYGEVSESNHIGDIDADGFCDECDAFMPTVSGSVSVGENTVTLPYSDDGVKFFTFVPSEDGEYVIKSESDTDPRLEVYDENGSCLDTADDENGLNFYLSIELTAGKNYYLGMYDYKGENSCKVIIKKLCDVHTPTGEATCKGTLCSVCYEYCGEAAEHSTEGEQTCNGYLCKWCEEYYGEAAEHSTEGEQTCNGYLCKWCEEYYGEAAEHSTEGEQTCNGYLCKWCEEYYGEAAEHSTEGEQTCRGYLCKWCEGYYGEAAEHSTEGEQTCKGYLCKWCEEYYGEAKDSHNDVDKNTFCDVCQKFMPVVDGNLTLNTVVTTVLPYRNEGYKIYKFVPSEDGVYLFKALSSDNDPLAIIYSDDGTWIGDNDDTDATLFYIEISLEAEKTYYLAVADFSEAAECSFKVTKSCDTHTYFYNYDKTEHWKICSVCGTFSSEDSVHHKYDDDGICECGRERLVGVAFGEAILVDGKYLDKEGNISDTAPEGGYAYLKDGVLTLSDFGYTYDGVDGGVLHTESDLKIVLVGKSVLTAMNGDGILGLNADITIGGEGSLIVSSYGNYDGVDMLNGTLTINGGTVLIKGSDHGIEIENGAFVMDGGYLMVDADDDGFELEDCDFTMNGGTLDVYADDYGIDVCENYSATINGGILRIYADDYNAIESGNLTITGGDVELITEDDDGIYVYGEFVISGGALKIVLEDTSYTVITAEGGITLPEGDYVVVEDDYYECYVIKLNDEYVTELEINLNADAEENKIWLDKDCVEFENDQSVYDGNAVTPELSVCDPESGDELTVGVDYTLTWLTDEIKESGIYFAVVEGMGDYFGKMFVEYYVHENTEIKINETIETNANYYYGVIYSYLSFTPAVTNTYTVSFTSNDYIAVFLLVDGEYTNDWWVGENGSVTIELLFEAGKIYSFELCDYECNGRCNVTLSCKDHVGGQATYTEKAVCEACGEHYGDILECSEHHGGEPTYKEGPVCEECGFHYGEALECDHMCHKGGVYAIVWGIFEKIYDFFGIESECKCGEMH